jgi:uncharacterized protein (TIGR02145 family)
MNRFNFFINPNILVFVTMIKTYFIRFLFLFMLIGSSAQAQLSVKSFGMLENDLDARVHHPLTDQNGDICAIIKVVTTQGGFSFDGGTMGIVKTVPKNAEIWVYVPWGIKRFTISHPQLGLLRDYMIPMAVEKATVYELVLISGTVTTIVEETIESQWLVITPEPENALVYINDEFVKTGEYMAKLKPGTYTYRVELPLYHTEAGRFDMGAEKNNLTVMLKPAYGYISVKSQPESGAQVFVNGKLLSSSTPLTTEAIASGEHTVQVVKEMFQPAVQKVTVTDGQTTPVTVQLQPNFAELSVNATAGASIVVNNEQKGLGSWSGRLGAGVYSVEARLAKHRPAKQDIELTAGDKRSLDLKPAPIYGSLDVVSSPSGATITIDGNEYGTTPNTLSRLLIGDYTVELSRQGYATVRKTISIGEGTSAMINETLTNGREVSIRSTPSGADLFVDGVAMGKTPYTGSLTFGSRVLKIERGGKTAQKTVEVRESGGETVFVVEIITVPTVYNPKTGKTWMDRNLGASRAAISSTDAEAYGDLYQWGRGTDGHEKRTSQTTSTLSSSNSPGHGNFITVRSGPYDWRSPQNNNLWQGVNGTNNPCPEGFRIPTIAEWKAELDSWGNKNSAGAFASPLKLPVAGYRHYSLGSLSYVGSYGFYWSSSVNGTYAQYLFFISSKATWSNDFRASGYSVRCLKDN